MQATRTGAATQVMFWLTVAVACAVASTVFVNLGGFMVPIIVGALGPESVESLQVGWRRACASSG